jgi:hypothetical protein
LIPGQGMAIASNIPHALLLVKNSRCRIPIQPLALTHPTAYSVVRPPKRGVGRDSDA